WGEGRYGLVGFGPGPKGLVAAEGPPEGAPLGPASHGRQRRSRPWARPTADPPKAAACRDLQGFSSLLSSAPNRSRPCHAPLPACSPRRAVGPDPAVCERRRAPRGGRTAAA